MTYDHRNDDRRINAHMERVKTSTVMNVQSTNTQTIDHKLYQFHNKIHFGFIEETFNCAPHQ